MNMKTPSEKKLSVCLNSGPTSWHDHKRPCQLVGPEKNFEVRVPTLPCVRKCRHPLKFFPYYYQISDVKRLCLHTCQSRHL